MTENKMVLNLGPKARRAKLRALAESLGLESVMEMLTEAVGDSVVTGICTAAGCDGTEETEPDQRRGSCPECGRPTLVSPLVLAGYV